MAGASRLHLKTLVLQSRVSFSEADLVWLLERLPTLVQLEINHSKKLSQRTLRAFLKEPTTRKTWLCPELEVLIVNGCHKVEWRDMMYLVEKRMIAVPETRQQEVVVKSKKKKVTKSKIPPARMRKVTLNGEDMIVAVLNEQAKENQPPPHAAID
ncbi:hypothetical protein FRB95_014169 [Tulasnella sp. JGI-2019a]|nr:hypothetical protein FRB95_014169 [Tulasnella sp. JGI-2019a]